MFVAAFFTPDFTSRADEIWQGMIESLTMTVTSTLAGILLAIPVGIGAARNVAPLYRFSVENGLKGVGSRE